MEASWFQRQSCHCINDLPDSIIHHILSFLPIKDVIRTSFISKRWRYLWTSVPNLDFDGLVFAPKIKFMRFVDSVLLHRGDSAIQRFSLRFGNYYCNNSHVQTWIQTAVSNNVQELSVASHTEEPFELPACMFMCRSLMVLSLNLYNSILNLPSSINLPFLRTLRLISIAFLDDNLIQVLSNCPVLENVHLEDCLIRGLINLNISSPSLRRLIIDGPPKDMNSYYGVVRNGIRVFAPKLLLFRYSNYFAQSVHLENVLSLVQASVSLNFDWDKREQACGQNLTNFLGDISNVKVLTLSSSTIGLLSAASDLLRLPTFSRLIHLNVSTAVSNDCIRAVTSILFNAPNLEFLSISISHRQRWFDKECFEPENAPFGSALNHLKVVKINGLVGDENELVFVKYLLEHACALERMLILFSKQLSVNSELQMKIKDNILMHPKASTSSEVICLNLILFLTQELAWFLLLHQAIVESVALDTVEKPLKNKAQHREKGKEREGSLSILGERLKENTFGEICLVLQARKKDNKTPI